MNQKKPSLWQATCRGFSKVFSDPTSSEWETQKGKEHKWQSKYTSLACKRENQIDKMRFEYAVKNVASLPVLIMIALELPLRSWGGLSSEMEVQNVKTQQTLPGRLISTCVIRGWVVAVHKLEVCCMDQSTARQLPPFHREMGKQCWHLACLHKENTPKGSASALEGKNHLGAHIMLQGSNIQHGNKRKQVMQWSKKVVTCHKGALCIQIYWLSCLWQHC